MIKIGYAGFRFERSEPMPSPALREANLKPYVERLLTAARETIDEVPFCWVVTSAGDGGANARIVKAQPTRDGEDFWTRWFLTPRIMRAMRN